MISRQFSGGDILPLQTAGGSMVGLGREGKTYLLDAIHGDGVELRKTLWCLREVEFGARRMR